MDLSPLTISPLQLCILALISGGMGIMFLAILKTRTVLRLLAGREGLGEWRILYGLMIFFLGGYSLAAVGVWEALYEAIALLTGLIFFFGALFVLFSTNTYYKTLFITQDKYLKAKDKAEAALHQLQQTQIQLIHQEKMLGLGSLAAGVAHEINNPVSFIHGNLYHLEEGISALLRTVRAIERSPHQAAALVADLELDFFEEDLPKALGSMRSGTERIRDTVKDLRCFSRLDEAHYKLACLNSDLQSTLRIFAASLESRLGPGRIALVADYGLLPKVECNPREVNQVVVHLLSNAVDAIVERDRGAVGRGVGTSPRSRRAGAAACLGTIEIKTRLVNEHQVAITIADDGVGIDGATEHRIFDPFFTTKPVGKGSGLGLAIARNIVVGKHQGVLSHGRRPEGGTEFQILLPIHLGLANRAHQPSPLATETARSSDRGGPPLSAYAVPHFA
jgi:two-component system NtrC family sensor kinase